MLKNTMSALILMGLFLITMSCNSQKAEDKTVEEKSAQTVYDFNVKKLMGEETSLSEYKGKVLLIVNVASNCGFTKQYTGLQKLYTDYSAKDFAVLGFPCNQFGGQEPGTAEDIQNFCESNYKVTFPMFDKIDVNGEKADPLYKFLKANGPGTITDDIKWNFTKFLINKDGKVVNRYSSQTKPEEIEADIVKLLNS